MDGFVVTDLQSGPWLKLPSSVLAGADCERLSRILSVWREAEYCRVNFLTDQPRLAAPGPTGSAPARQGGSELAERHCPPMEIFRKNQWSEKMISSLIPGRIRIRYAALKNPETARIVEDGLNTCPWVNRAAVNPLAGSLLIEYDAAQMDMETARRMLVSIAPDGADWLEEYEAALGGYGYAAPADNGQSDGRISKDAAEYLAMTGAFMLCTASAALRARGLHIHSGLIWAGLTVQHIHKFRKKRATR